MMGQLKHLINRGGLKRGELNVLAIPTVIPPIRAIPLTNNKELQLTLEINHVKQDSPSNKQI